jgi:hypothetical protein
MTAKVASRSIKLITVVGCLAIVLYAFLTKG